MVKSDMMGGISEIQKIKGNLLKPQKPSGAKTRICRMSAFHFDSFCLSWVLNEKSNSGML